MLGLIVYGVSYDSFKNKELRYLIQNNMLVCVIIWPIFLIFFILYIIKNFFINFSSSFKSFFKIIYELSKMLRSPQ